MSNRTFTAVGNFFGMVRSAVAVSSAVEAGRKPRARDLRALGIDPESLGKIGR